MHILFTALVLVAIHMACNGAPRNPLSPVLYEDKKRKEEKYHQVYERQAPPPTAVLPVCSPDQLDRTSICASWKAVGFCGSSNPHLKALMRRNCFFTCGNCRLPSLTTSPPGPTTVITTTAGLTTTTSTSERPSTAVLSTEGPTLVALTSVGPVTTASSTQRPTTEFPTTMAMTSEGPTTMAMTSEGPTTMATTSEGPTTMAPTTSESPTTLPPTTSAAPENLFVTLAVFSGLPDPEWSVSQNHPHLSTIRRLLLVARDGGLTYRPEDMPAILGYKGFLVNDTIGEQLILGRETVPLQELLLETMPRSSLLIPEYLEVIRTGEVSAEVAPSISKRFAPPYLPANWNDDLKIRRKSNCYNYANGKITNTFAQPGRGSGLIFDQLIGNVVRVAAERDGLVVLNPHPLGTDPVPTAPVGPQHLVALFVDPESCNIPGDFHWYRLDQGGLWSHKPGQTRVTQGDERGKVITDPRKAATGRYRFFAFMTSDTNTVTIA